MRTEERLDKLEKNQTELKERLDAIAVSQIIDDQKIDKLEQELAYAYDTIYEVRNSLNNR